MKTQFNQMLEVSTVKFFVFYLKLSFLQEQINKIRSYEARVNKAKSNYTKALQRLEELNKKIYDNTDLDSSDEYLHLSTSHVNIAEGSKNQSEKENSPCSTSKTIFDNKVLNDLILEDNIESTLEQLKSQSLT